MKKTKLKIMSLVLAGILSVGFVSYNGYFNNNIKVEATETDEDTSWTVIDYNKLTDADLSAEDIALMHEDNWVNQEVASEHYKSVSDLTLSDFLSIKDLYKGGSNITNIPNSIKFLSNLLHLGLYGNELTSLPNSIGNLINLTNLNLGANNLTGLPDAIGNLSNLTKLALEGNSLTALPETIGNLTNLTDLEVWTNNLTILPDTIGNLTNLTTLSLSENKLTEVPDTIGNLTNLTYLDLDDNHLTEIPETIGNLTKLETLSLYGNILTNIPKNIPSSASNRNLYLGNNFIEGLMGQNQLSLNNDEIKFTFKVGEFIDTNTLKNNINRIYGTATRKTILSNDDISNMVLTSSDTSIISNEGKALKEGTATLTLSLKGASPTNTNASVNFDVTVEPKLISSERTLNVKFTQPNTMSLTIDTNEINFGEVNGLTDSSEKTVIASVNSSLPYDLSIKSLDENLTSTEGKAIPVSKLNVKGEGEYINIGTTDNIIYTNQPNTNGEEVTHPMNFKLSEMTGYTKGEYSTNLRVTATQK